MRNLIAFVLVCAARGGVVDRVAVVVASEAITQSEVEEEARMAQFLNNEPLDLSAAARRAAADRLVDQYLIRQEMEVSRFPGPNAAEADNMLRKLRAERFPSTGGFQAALRKYGVSEDELKTHLRWQLAAMRFTDQRFRNGPGQPEPTRRNTTARTAARMVRPGGPAPANVDEAMDQWLADARGRTHIEFKPEAFQ
jgi:hypothetical protein